jgi:hypothetical protein
LTRTHHFDFVGQVNIEAVLHIVAIFHLGHV